MQLTEQKITKVSQSLHKVAKLRQIIAVGFNEKEYAQLKKYKNGSIGFELKVIDNAFSTYQWLTNHNFDSKDEKPAAILFSLQFLIDNQFSISKQIISNKDIPVLPLIAINTNGVNI